MAACPVAAAWVEWAAWAAWTTKPSNYSLAYTQQQPGSDRARLFCLILRISKALQGKITPKESYDTSSAVQRQPSLVDLGLTQSPIASVASMTLNVSLRVPNGIGVASTSLSTLTQAINQKLTVTRSAGNAVRLPKLRMHRRLR